MIYFTVLFSLPTTPRPPNYNLSCLAVATVVPFNYFLLQDFCISSTPARVSSHQKEVSTLLIVERAKNKIIMKSTVFAETLFHLANSFCRQANV